MDLDDVISVYKIAFSKCCDVWLEMWEKKFANWIDQSNYKINLWMSEDNQIIAIDKCVAEQFGTVFTGINHIRHIEIGNPDWNSVYATWILSKNNKKRFFFL